MQLHVPTYCFVRKPIGIYIIVQLVVHIVVSENLLVSHISISTASNIKNFDRIDCWRWGYSFSMRTVGHFFSHENALEFVDFSSSKKLWIVWGNIIIQDYSHSFFLKFEMVLYSFVDATFSGLRKLTNVWCCAGWKGLRKPWRITHKSLAYETLPPKGNPNNDIHETSICPSNRGGEVTKKFATHDFFYVNLTRRLWCLSLITAAKKNLHIILIIST